MSNIKKKTKELLESRKINLKFIEMDLIFYHENKEDLLKLDPLALQDTIVKIESELKLKKNWKGEKEKARRAMLVKKINTVNEQLQEYKETMTTINQLITKEKDLIEYISFLEDYIKRSRWAK